MASPDKLEQQIKDLDKRWSNIEAQTSVLAAQIVELGNVVSGSESSSVKILPQATPVKEAPPATSAAVSAPQPDTVKRDEQEDPGEDIFSGNQVLLVTQLFEVSELFGIEAANRYNVSAANGTGETIFFMQEKSTPFQLCCCAPCRSLTVSVYAGDSATGDALFTFEKDKFTCPMLPCPLPFLPGGACVSCCSLITGGPKFTVKAGDKSLGTVTNKHKTVCYCKLDSDIQDAAGEILFQAGPVCLCAPSSCDQRVPVFKEGAEVASFTRKALKCAERCKKTNRFEVDFGQIQDPSQKPLILAAATQFDIHYWEPQNK
jgi:hypothetical protein